VSSNKPELRINYLLLEALQDADGGGIVIVLARGLDGLGDDLGRGDKVIGEDVLEASVELAEVLSALEEGDPPGRFFLFCEKKSKISTRTRCFVRGGQNILGVELCVGLSLVGEGAHGDASTCNTRRVGLRVCE